MYITPRAAKIRERSSGIARQAGGSLIARPEYWIHMPTAKPVGVARPFATFGGGFPQSVPKTKGIRGFPATRFDPQPFQRDSSEGMTRFPYEGSAEPITKDVS